MPATALRLIACVLAASTLACATAAAGTARRNIVVLLADDLGFTDLGSFGSEIATPHLDELARRGTRFSNFHVSASCSPTRAMLLTGVDNHRNGVGNMRETIPREHAGRPGYLSVLDTNVVTIATLLRDGGYRTYASGKWHVGKEPHNLPPARGFDRSIVQGDSGSDNWVPQQRYLPHSAGVDWFEDGKPAKMPAEYYSSQYFVDRAIEFIDSGAGSGKPFFAYIAFQANHVPLQAPREFIDKYGGRYDQGWTALRRARRDRAAELGLIPRDAPMTTMHTTGDWDSLSAKDKRYQARRMEVYAAMAEAMDHHVGRLVAHLKKAGEFDNTVFVFLSDNGPEGSDYREAQLWLRTQYSQDIDRLGDKGGYAIMGPGWASAAAAPLDTFKFYAGEGGIRVPLIVAGVPGMASGRVHAGLTHVTDIVPTLLEVAQLPRPGASYQGRPVEPPAGRSLLPVLMDPEQRVRAADEVLGFELSGNRALFKGDLKLVSNLPPIGDGQWHLYDLRTDPGETRDLRQQMPEAFRAMQADYEAWAAAHGVLPMPPGYDPIRQVLTNSLHNYWIPTYRNAALASLAGVLVLVAAVLTMRRRRRTG
jgi:arylsulfatase/uncharacterized sulfatase